MQFKVRCIKHLAKDRVWLLESGKLYLAQKRNENEIEVVNHYGVVVTLSLKDFSIYCVVI